MAKQKHFDSFLSNIEPSKTTVDYISSVQNNLRDYLANHHTYKNVHISTFLSGSYAKYTNIRPVKNDNKRDVDIIVVTNHSSSDGSSFVLEELLGVLAEKSDYEDAKIQSRSVGIEMGGINIDVVPVIENDDDNLYSIGKYADGSWTPTDPKGHKKWSTEVNQNNDNQYKPLVKIFKWWRRLHCSDEIKYPKGIALEKIIADNIADSSLSTENLFIGTLQNIVSAYKEDYVDQHEVPVISDPTVSDNNLMSGYGYKDFKAFIDNVESHLALLDAEGTTNDTWRKILGNEFPTDDSSKNALALSALSITKCLEATHRQKPVWNVPRGNSAFIGAVVYNQDGTSDKYESDTYTIPKGCGIVYSAICAIKPPFHVKWQVVNTGNDASNHNCLRGGFENSNEGSRARRESTAYTGKHYVQCFIIKGGGCVAKSKEFIINVE